MNGFCDLYMLGSKVPFEVQHRYGCHALFSELFLTLYSILIITYWVGYHLHCESMNYNRQEYYDLEILSIYPKSFAAKAIVLAATDIFVVQN